MGCRHLGWYARRVLPPVLSRLVQSYTKTLLPSTASAATGALAASLVVAALVAREGTERTRAIAVTLLLVACVAIAFRLWVQSRWGRDPTRAIKAVLISTQPDVGQRILRALALSERAETKAVGESKDLARHHYERMLSRASVAAVTATARRRARRFGSFAFIALLASGATILFAPQPLLEGVDVGLARNGIAPFPMQWLEDAQVEATPPAYLRKEKATLGFESADVMPDGTQLEFRGFPLHDGRKLVLTDGKREQPFVDDGSGAVVARWELAEPAELRVAARFGNVVIPDERSVDIYAMEDRAPVVKLGGAPRDIALETMDTLELHWSATDDHSIVEVELVLRSAGKEERRTLERYPGDKKQAVGGYVLKPDDPLLQKLFLPAIVRVEARDNDPREGSKWGKSEAFTIRPPAVGSSHVARYVGLSRLRDELVELLVMLHRTPLATPAERREAKVKIREKVKAVRATATLVTQATYLGLEVPRGWATFASGQLKALDQVDNLTGAKAEKAIAVTEQATLAVDQALQSLAYREAQAVSKQLANVADEAAFGAHAAQGEKARVDGIERLDLATSVLRAGALELSKLGMLGADLGSVALADLGRVVRSRSAEDYFHAELAALHMAARLRRPNPSFGAKGGGGGGGGGGVESGPGNAGGEGSDAEGETSEAESKFDDVARQLEELSQEHQEAVEQTSRAMRDAEQKLGAEDEEAKRRAEELRRKLMRLPEPGEPPGSGRASAALAREHGGAMAHELERGDFAEAVEGARRALSAGEDALRKGDLGPALESELRQALDAIREQMRWAEEKLEERNQRAEEAAREALEKVSKLEQELAERARRLLGEDGLEQGLPGESIERLERAQQLMQEATRRLSDAKGNEGLELQRDAQRLLEQARPGRTSDEDKKAPDGEQHDGGKKPATGGDVPDPDKRNKAEEFRRRVLEGLKESEGGRLAPAIQRYAEGLLQ
jgi:hypothetical protein